MRKSLRTLLVGLTGATVFASGAAITVASPALAASASVDITDSDSFIPPTGNDTIPFTVKITDPWKNGKAPTVKAEFWKEGETGASRAAVVTQPTDPATGTSPAATLDVKGGVPVTASDKPTTAASGTTPAGEWKVKVSIFLNGNTSTSADATATDSFVVKPATRVTNVDIDPSSVVLKSGGVDVGVRATIEKFGDEKLTGVKIAHHTGDYYTLGTGMEYDDKTYIDYTTMDYSSPTGTWQLKFTITRGSKTYAFTKNFSVRKGTAKKAKSKITLSTVKSVKKGKAIKLYGKVYRGHTSWGAWSKKITKLYFKKKGTKSWKFVTYVGANSTGKYSKSVKPKYDGYWRLYAPGTSLTYSSWSKYKYVNVK